VTLIGLGDSERYRQRLNTDPLSPVGKFDSLPAGSTSGEDLGSLARRRDGEGRTESGWVTGLRSIGCTGLKGCSIKGDRPAFGCGTQCGARGAPFGASAVS
jgi:hypothetical protein